MTSTTTPQPISVVVLISGSGSNLQAIIDATLNNELPISISAVISNRPDAKGLQRAQNANIETRIVDHKDFPDRDVFDAELKLCIDSFSPDLVVLAGFMRILTKDFVEHYSGRMLNIHPALLPNFPGLNTHERALESGVEQHGASVHFVTTEVDGGPIVLQANVDVLDNDDADILAARVLEKEHLIYPLAIKWYAEGRLTFKDNQLLLDDSPLPATGINYADDKANN